MTIDQVKKINDQQELAQIVRMHNDISVKEAAVKQMTDQVILHEIAGGNYFYTLQGYAERRITDESLLADLVKNASSFVIQRQAAERITDKNALLEILDYHKDEYTLNAVLYKLADLHLLRDFVNKTQNQLAVDLADKVIGRLEIANRVKKTDSNKGNLTWDDTEQLVKVLSKKYPDRPPVALSDDDIFEMVVALDEFNDFPLPPDDIYLSGIQYDWIKHWHGDDT